MLALLVLAGPVLAGPVLAEERRLEVDLGPGQWLDWYWQAATMTVDPSGWAVAVHGLGQADQVWLDQLHGQCPVSDRLADGCRDGRLLMSALGQQIDAGLLLEPGDGYWQATVTGAHWSARLRLPLGDEQPLWAALTLEGWPLEQIPAEWLEALGLNLLVGQLDGQLVLEGDRLAAELEWTHTGFDSPDGRLAGDGLTVGLEAQATFDNERITGDLALSQSSGEWLLDSLYLPPPAEPLSVSLSWEHVWGAGLELGEIRLADGSALAVQGSLSLLPGAESGWRVERARVESGWINLSRAWPRWFEGPVAAAGFPGLMTTGRVEFELDWQAEQPLIGAAMLRDLVLVDPQGRFALARVDGQLRQGPEQQAIDIDWVAMALWGLPLGGGSLSLVPDLDDPLQPGLRLARPLRVPLLDGAVVMDRLNWRPGQEQGLMLDARIETLSLTELTRALNWPEFGGQLAAEFPGVVLAGERLDFTGGIDIEAFSGRIGLDELAVERPFGSLPAVSAQLRFDRLDLDELTGAFNFGRMEGQVSGWARNLRLLDWHPVAMDARIFTHEDVPRRRISQRAVDNLTSLGGAGGALINTTVLAVFDDFPYRRAGLACRLSNNICHLDGVAPHESGGFYIVEGRGLPRLNVIGHRRLMDWPQFVGQLEAIMN